MSGLTLRVFDSTGETQAGYLTQVLDSKFVDEFNGPGFGEVQVPLDSDDAALLVRDAVVKVNYEGAVRFAWFIEEIDRTLVDSDGRRTIKASGRGLLGWLDDCIVFPQRGLTAWNNPQRGYNYVAEDGAWTASTTFSTPSAVAWTADTTARSKAPLRWPDKAASWIWATSPTGTVQTGTVNWFRSTFTLASPKRVRFAATADNEFDLYLDGQLLLSSSDFSGQGATWTQFKTRTLNLGQGSHQLAARVRNGSPWIADDVSVSASDDKVSVSDHGLANGTKLTVVRVSKANGLTEGNDYYVVSRTADDFKLSTSSGGSAVDISEDSRIDLRAKDDNSAGFIMTAYQVTANNKQVAGGLVRHTDAANWTVAATEPRWYPALIVKDALEEAQARGVSRVDQITFDYTATKDSADVSWSTGVAVEIAVGTSVLDVLSQCVDFGIDFWLRPTDRRLFAWENRGSDLTGTVRLFPGRHFLRFQTVTEPRLKTVALVRTKDGWATAKSANAGTYGRREMFMELGKTKSEATAATVAGRALRKLGRAVVVASGVEAIPVDGAVPYVDFAVGDYVTIPAPAGSGTRTARVLSLALVYEGADVRYQPELEVLDA